MAENEQKDIPEEETDEVDGNEEYCEEKKRSKRSVITVPDREYEKDGVKYRKDQFGKWRPVIEIDFEQE